MVALSRSHPPRQVVTGYHSTNSGPEEARPLMGRKWHEVSDGGIKTTAKYHYKMRSPLKRLITAYLF